MKNTLRISFSLKNTYRVNSILYSVKQLPVLKKILPDSLYRMRGFKIAGNVLSYIWEVVSGCFCKALYFMFLLGCSAMLASTERLSFNQTFINLYLFLALVGAVSNFYMFDTHKSKYYAIMLLNVDAKKYNIINYIYQIFKLLLCYAVAFVIITVLWDLPVWICVLGPLYTIGLKNSAVALSLIKYKHKGKIDDNNLFGKFTFPFVVLCVLLGCGLPLLSLSLPYFVICIIMILAIIAGLWGLGVIIKFEEYREISRETLLNTAKLNADAKQARRNTTLNTISDNTDITSNKKGFEFLNEIFIKRHSKILWKPVLIISAICFAVFLVANIFTAYIFEIQSALNEFLLNSLPYFLFIMYAINRGTSYTQALFINCDHSLLTYSIYKKPVNILKLFTIRLREIVKMNLVPAVVIGVGLVSLMYVSGGTKDLINYILLFVTPIAMSVFFSVHNLTIYYLLQPYNADTEIKSATYSIIMGATYMVCYVFMQIELPTLYFSIAVIVFCIIYCIVSSILVYKYAPKTFRIRV